MQDTENLLSKAQQLGEALAAHPGVKAHYEAQRCVRTDTAARKLLKDYQAQLDHIRQMEAQQQPVEVADKQKLKQLEAQMAGNEVLKTLMRTQTDYVALMNQVNQAMEAPLATASPPENPA